METLKQANYALKTESVKNRTVCNDLNNYHTYGTQNSEKLGQLQKFAYQYCVKNLEFFYIPVKSENSNTGRKSFCFCTESNQQESTLSQRLCLALY